MCPNELIYAVTTIAMGIAKGRSDEEVSVLAAIFTQLGDTLATIIVQRGICENVCSEDSNKSSPSVTESTVI